MADEFLYDVFLSYSSKDTPAVRRWRDCVLGQNQP